MTKLQGNLSCARPFDRVSQGSSVVLRLSGCHNEARAAKCARAPRGTRLRARSLCSVSSCLRWLAISLASPACSFFVPVTSVFPLMVANQPTASTKGPTTLDHPPPGASRRQDTFVRYSRKLCNNNNSLLLFIYNVHANRPTNPSTTAKRTPAN